MGLYDRVIEAIAPTRLGGWLFLRVATPVDRVLFKLTRGKVTSGFGSKFGGRILLLTTRGAKSGLVRQVPLLYAEDGDALVLVASRGGDQRHPAWYFNAKKHPDVEVTRDGVTEPRRAREVDGAERDRLWQVVNAGYRGYATYQGRVDRTIPVILLERR